MPSPGLGADGVQPRTYATTAARRFTIRDGVPVRAPVEQF
ncbi:hypothetical protein FHS12_000196 [Nocardioides albus]|uniref:Uncharacterized protein n=1 Tax=Nocardioides albus TaxID=1841 RepID=A0A7W5A0H5_9ACTN|nr:hypothetical protein [Nocardioides albus]